MSGEQAARLLALGLCSRGHDLAGPDDLTETLDGVTRCARCALDMAFELAAISVPPPLPSHYAGRMLV